MACSYRFPPLWNNLGSNPESLITSLLDAFCFKNKHTSLQLVVLRCIYADTNHEYLANLEKRKHSRMCVCISPAKFTSWQPVLIPFFYADACLLKNRKKLIFFFSNKKKIYFLAWGTYKFDISCWNLKKHYYLFDLFKICPLLRIINH